MFSFNEFYHGLYIIVLLQYTLYPYTVATAISSEVKHNPNYHSNGHLKYRCKRRFISWFSNSHEPKHQTGNNSPVIYSSGTGADPTSSMPANSWLNLVQQQTGRAVQSATDMMLTPVH